jgi:L-iduronidase
MRISVDFKNDGGSFRHFWEATGLTPAQILLTPPMRQILTFCGSVPFSGIRHARIHYLLELVKITGTDTQGRFLYDWEDFDNAIDTLVHNKIKPFFELMGIPHPHDRFTDFNDPAQAAKWKNFVRDVAQHCIDRYGAEEVRSWYFESWNEPDIDTEKSWVDTPSFLHYYDACSEGLREADEGLVFGGPGTAWTLSGRFKEFLAHCDNGGARLDFISVHEKGANPSPEDLNPDMNLVCENEKKALEYIREHHPRLAALPFMNNECDPQIGYNDFHTWHGRPYYAAIVCKAVGQHLERFIDSGECRYELLSNDNGFPGKWGNRSLLSCFGRDLNLHFNAREARRREDKTGLLVPDHRFSQVKKPVFIAMVMLSMLGDRRCKVELNQPADDSFGVIATKTSDGNQAAVLLYYNRDKIMSDGKMTVQLDLQPYLCNMKDAALVHYVIDENHGDPFRLWEEAKGPEMPEDTLIDAMRENQEPTITDEIRYYTENSDMITLQTDLLLPSVHLFLVSAKTDAPPDKVTGLRLERYTGCGGRREMMVIWETLPSRVIRTYEVFYGERLEDPFARVNGPDLLCGAFIHTLPEESAGGFYTIRAVDYWGRCGEWSEIIADRF